MKGLDISSRMPSEMQDYIENYGFHFNKKAFDYASKSMKKNGSMVEPYTKEQVDELLTRQGITLKNDKMYDAAYVATMAKADFWKSSIVDESHLALFIKDYLDDEDACGEEPFRRWIADRIGREEPIDWYAIL